MKNDNIVPVLLGGDLNSYSTALAFREAFGVNSHAYVRYRCGATENSRFIKTHIFPELEYVSLSATELLSFADKHTEGELYLVPCADRYVKMLEYSKDILSPVYNIHIPEYAHFSLLSNKETFYSEMKIEGIPYPEFIKIEKNDLPNTAMLSSFSYPAVLKPSDGNEYWKHSFPGMEKVYFPKDALEAARIINRIFESGYPGSLILQKKVGKSADNYVLTCISDKSGNVVRAVLGKVILEETGKTSIGNHSAIITVPLDSLSEKLIAYLNKIKYSGIANFDIMKSNGKEYVLELNPRQGRSCDYLRCAGVNIAELLVSFARGEEVKPDFDFKEIYWHYPDNKSVIRYSDPKELEKISALCKRGADYSPYKNKFEGIKRRIYVFVHGFRLDGAIRKNIRSEVK